jgi:ABC-type transporter Mla subunit MlaD
MSLIKISATLLAAVGAKTDAEFSDCLSNTLASIKSSHDKLDAAITDAASNLKTLAESNKTLSASLEDANKKIAELESKKILSEEEIRKIASAEGSKTAMEAIGSVGAGSPPATPSAAASTSGKTAVDGLIAAKKYKDAFNASESIQQEFITAEGYEAFMKAQEKGMVGKVYSK